MHTNGIALAGQAVGHARLLESQGIAEESALAVLAVEPGGVVDTPETLPGGAVAVADGARVHVVVAVAPLAGPDLAAAAHGVPEVAVVADLAPGPHAALGALDADGALRVARVLDASSAVRAGAGRAVA